MALMLFEMAGFLLGMLAMGSALFVLYRRQANRALDAINTGHGLGPRI
jgi:hypothetical protein